MFLIPDAENIAIPLTVTTFLYLPQVIECCAQVDVLPKRQQGPCLCWIRPKMLNPLGLLLDLQLQPRSLDKFAANLEVYDRVLNQSV